jgi:putative transposase
MAQKNQRRSIRIPSYDYTQPGAYFITVVTNQRACILSQIGDGLTNLSPVGRLVEQEWLRLPLRFSHTHLDVYTVMPNHLHGIIVIDQDPSGGETRHGQYPATAEAFAKPVPGSIPTMIRSFKSATTSQYRKLNRSHEVLWQRNYFERVIRNDGEWQRIRDYILANPLNWESDQENPSKR